VLVFIDEGTLSIGKGIITLLDFLRLFDDQILERDLNPSIHEISNYLEHKKKRHLTLLFIFAHFQFF
jgi:hypothetical protein